MSVELGEGGTVSHREQRHPDILGSLQQQQQPVSFLDTTTNPISDKRHNFDDKRYKRQTE